ncbi:hypothetical protein L204_102343 [Cryptococcus depauperatus]
MRIGQLQAMRVYNGDDDIRMTDIATVTGIHECMRKVSNNPFDQGCSRQLELGETNVAEIVRLSWGEEIAHLVLSVALAMALLTCSGYRVWPQQG